jgi:hypothetical protein
MREAMGVVEGLPSLAVVVTTSGQQGFATTTDGAGTWSTALGVAGQTALPYGDEVEMEHGDEG